MKLFAFAFIALIATNVQAEIKTPDAVRYLVAIKQLDEAHLMGCGRMVCEIAHETLGAGCAVNGGRVISTTLTRDAANVVASLRCVESVMERGIDPAIDAANFIF